VDLDDALAELTRHQPGVDLREEAGLDRISCGHDGIEAWSSDGACHRARYLVAADGAWSPTRRALGGLGDTGPASWRRTGEWHAMRQYFSNVPDAAQRLWVWFEPELLPAYAWSFPLNHGVVNVGLGIIHGHGLRPAQMGPVWRGLLERPHVRRVLGDQLKAEGPMKAWPIPTSVDPALWTGGDGRVLFVGDAARLGDPMTGEGIGQALESGRLAAEAVVAAGSDHPPAAAERYRSAVAACIGSDNRLASGLTRVLSRPWAARAGLAAIGMNRWTRSHFARWMFEDYPRAILATPARWQKGVFSPPGAYRLGQ
jgi:flavin-dependent dehydrogenase